MLRQPGQIDEDFVVNAKVSSKHDDRLFAIGVAALPTRPGIRIWAIHVGDDNIGPIDAFDVFSEDLFRC